jgi:hypothetical protein
MFNVGQRTAVAGAFKLAGYEGDLVVAPITSEDERAFLLEPEALRTLRDRGVLEPPARLAARPRPDPGNLPASRPRRVAGPGQRRDPQPGRPLRPLGLRSQSQPRPARRRRPLDRASRAAGPGTALAERPPPAARRQPRHRRPRRRAPGAALRPDALRHQPPHPRRHRHLALALPRRAGRQAGRAVQLAGRLHKIGIRPARDRSTALFQLATELPAAVLARTLGIHVKVAIEWQHASAGDWGSYAADVSRRPRPVPSRHETPART